MQFRHHSNSFVPGLSRIDDKISGRSLGEQPRSESRRILEVPRRKEEQEDKAKKKMGLLFLGKVSVTDIALTKLFVL